MRLLHSIPASRLHRLNVSIERLPDAFGIIAGPCPLHGPQSDHDHGLKIIILAEVSKRTNILSSRNFGVRD